MPDVSPLLDLPLIQPDQAQKHITHNEAVDRLDALVQLVVEQFDTGSPPPAPTEGEVWALGAAPTGAWAGQALKLASWRNGGWLFIAPRAGWRAWGRATGGLRVFTGTGWGSTIGSDDLQNLGGVGINTGSDAVNRLAVAADATLLTHDGGGHQLKINKAAAAQTASLLFQTDWSGRAEMGLAGSDDFAVKVSADGTSFTTGLTVAAASGVVTAPVGLHLADGSAAAPGLGFAADTDTGLNRPGADQIGLVAGGVQRALLSATALQVDVPLTGSAVQSAATDITAGRLMRADYGYCRGNILGAVAQSAGVPTGAIIERGSNANGEWLRFADGTQFAFSPALTGIAVTTAAGALFRSATQSWTLPVGFVSTWAVSGYTTGAYDCYVGPVAGATTLLWQAISPVSRSGMTFRLMQIGRWF